MLDSKHPMFKLANIVDKKDGRGCKNDKEQTAFIDSTVQEKNITFPTDSKLLNKVIEYYYKVRQSEGIKIRQSYTREIKGLKLVQRFRGKANSHKKVAKADKKMRTILLCLIQKCLECLRVAIGGLENWPATIIRVCV